MWRLTKGGRNSGHAVALLAVLVAGCCAPGSRQQSAAGQGLEFILACDHTKGGGVKATLFIINRGPVPVLIAEPPTAMAERERAGPGFAGAGCGPLWGTICWKGPFTLAPVTDSRLEELRHDEAFYIAYVFEGDFLPDRRDYARNTLTIGGHVLVIALHGETDFYDLGHKTTWNGRYDARFVNFEVKAPFPTD